MQVVPANPDHPDFHLGKTLGAEHTNWRRVKKGMPDRCRAVLPLRFEAGQADRLRAATDPVDDLEVRIHRRSTPRSGQRTCVRNRKCKIYCRGHVRPQAAGEGPPSMTRRAGFAVVEAP